MKKFNSDYMNNNNNNKLFIHQKIEIHIFCYKQV